LNGVAGVVFGFLFLRLGIGATILAHFGAGFIWHVAAHI
jgi:hypothetical protein